MKVKHPIRLFYILTGIITFLLISSSLYSQNLEDGTREIDRLNREKVGDKLVEKPPEKPEELITKEERPVPPEEKKIPVKKITLLGCESFSPESFASFAAKYENREAALSELEALCKSIEREYLRRGVIAAVFVPPQEIKEGEVSLRVVEAKMGELPPDMWSLSGGGEVCPP